MGRYVDDNTITTFHSNTTTLNSNNVAKFAELDQAIKNSQMEFTTMNSRFDEMDTRMINTMESCHAKPQTNAGNTKPNELNAQ